MKQKHDRYVSLLTKRVFRKDPLWMKMHDDLRFLEYICDKYKTDFVARHQRDELKKKIDEYTNQTYGCIRHHHSFRFIISEISKSIKKIKCAIFHTVSTITE